MGPEALPPGSSELGRQKQQKEGELGQHPHAQKRRVSGTWPSEATHGQEELTSEGASPTRGGHPVGRLRRPAECSHLTGEKTEAPREHGAPTRPIQGTGTTEPQSKPRAHHCPAPGGISCSQAGPRHPLSSSPALALSEVN